MIFELNSMDTGLLEKVTGVQLVKKFSDFYGNRIFVAGLTRALYWTLY
jgi:hypothetical protein